MNGIDCGKNQVWPDMQARITGDSPCLPPFGTTLAACSYAFLAVSVPNRAFVDWLERIWLVAVEQS